MHESTKESQEFRVHVHCTTQRWIWFFSFLLLRYDNLFTVFRQSNGTIAFDRHCFLCHPTITVYLNANNSTTNPSRSATTPPRHYCRTAALWSGTNKNQDVSTGSLARPFARLLARSLRSLAHFAHSLTLLTPSRVEK